MRILLLSNRNCKVFKTTVEFASHSVELLIVLMRNKYVLLLNGQEVKKLYGFFQPKKKEEEII